MSASRRGFIRGALAAAGVASATVGARASSKGSPDALGREVDAQAPRVGPKPVPVQTPDLPRLPWSWDNGVKVFHLVAEPVSTEFLPGRPVDVWGFNGSMPGPTIEAEEGDRVRFVVENRLPELFSMHWHGLEVPLDMDGTPGISQDPIPPGGTFVYEFQLRQHGTFFYHSHMAMQELMGLVGLFVIHPTTAHEPRVDRDVAFKDAPTGR